MKEYITYIVKAVVNDEGQLFCVQEFTQKHSINGLLFFNIRMYQHKKKGKKEKRKEDEYCSGKQKH